MEQQLRNTIALHAVKDFRHILIHHIDQRVYRGAPPICGPLYMLLQANFNGSPFGWKCTLTLPSSYVAGDPWRVGPIEATGQEDYLSALNTVCLDALIVLLTRNPDGVRFNGDHFKVAGQSIRHIVETACWVKERNPSIPPPAWPPGAPRGPMLPVRAELSADVLAPPVVTGPFQCFMEAPASSASLPAPGGNTVAGVPINHPPPALHASSAEQAPRTPRGSPPPRESSASSNETQARP